MGTDAPLLRNGGVVCCSNVANGMRRQPKLGCNLAAEVPLEVTLKVPLGRPLSEKHRQTEGVVWRPENYIRPPNPLLNWGYGGN